MKNHLVAYLIAKVCLVFFALTISTPLSAKSNIPQVLAPWSDWALHGQSHLKCPFINKSKYGEAKSHLCIWASPITITVAPSRGQFSLTVEVMDKSLVPLPGDIEVWPQDVTVNGKRSAVVAQNDRPMIELEVGKHQIKGGFVWPTPPEAIAIAPQYATVSLILDGQEIDFPKIEDQQLWLQQYQPSEQHADTLDMTVVRKVSDGDYIELETRIEVNVSGKMREENLGLLLPDGFELIGLNSELPAYLDAKGQLQVKVKPGGWDIVARAYARANHVTWRRPKQLSHWPQDEIWLFEANEELRFGKLAGAVPVDNNQVAMPDEWYEFPSYLFKPEQALTYDVQHRGQPLQLQNQLTLNRKMWRSFDNTRYSIKDTITGQMIDSWRLSMEQPYTLQAAENADGNMLITTTGNGETGVETRYPEVNVTAFAELPDATTLPTTGWQSRFEIVSVELNVPPGERLFAVFGADRVSSSWLDDWGIWAFFIVLFSSILVGRMLSPVAGILSLLTLIFIYQEHGAPIIAMLNLVLAIAIKQYQPFTKLSGTVKSYWLVSIIAAIATILFFVAMQLRVIVHPQLAHDVYNTNVIENFAQPSYSLVDEINVPNQQLRMVKKEQSFDESVDVERIEITGSRIKQADLIIERYRSDALVQAGNGVPNWSWQPHYIEWRGQVEKGQTYQMLILSKNQYRAVKLVGVVLLLLWLGFLLKEQVRGVFAGVNKHAANTAPICLILCATLLYSPQGMTANMPDKAMLDELAVRLSEAPLCSAGSCATISSVELNLVENQLRLTLTIDAVTDTAVALPRADFWRIESVTIDQQNAFMYKSRNWVYTPIAKGVSEVILSGPVAAVDVFEISFKSIPRVIKQIHSPGWDVAGIQQQKMTGRELELLKVQQQGAASTESERYNVGPFVRVTRSIVIDKLWYVRTNVERIAPAIGSINVNVPVLAGENITSSNINQQDGFVQVNIPSTEDAISWHSILDQKSQIALLASDSLPIVEHWNILATPSWNVEFNGLPSVLFDGENDDYFSHLFYPLAGEKLEIVISRPDGVKGRTLAFDEVQYQLEQSKSAVELIVDFKYRSTRGGEHTISLPSEFELQQVKIDERLINLQMSDSQLSLPVTPGEHQVAVTLRKKQDAPNLLNAPKVNFNAPISNINLDVTLNRDRWVLWSSGPVLGPAIVYWGELLAFIVVALLLSRVTFSPLNVSQWLLLGLGLSLNNWGVLILLVTWFALLSATKYRSKDIGRIYFNASQLGLFIVSLISIISLVLVIPMSLLSAPEMGITGNGSYANYLRWFSDRSDGQTPDILVFSIPMVAYKAVMLAWVMWLSFSMLNWLKWAWQQLGSQGFWRSKQADMLLNDE